MHVVVLLKAFLTFAISYLLAYYLLLRFRVQKPKWIALTYSFAYTLVLVSREYTIQPLHQLLLAIIGAVAIIAVAVATAIPRKTETPLYPSS